MLGSKKAPPLVGGAKAYKRPSRKPNTCFRSRAIPGARIGSRKKSPGEAGPSVLRKEGYFRSSAAKQFRGRGLVPTAASARHKSHRVLPQNNRCPLLPALSGKRGRRVRRPARSAREEAEVNETRQLVSGIAADWWTIGPVGRSPGSIQNNSGLPKDLPPPFARLRTGHSAALTARGKLDPDSL